MTSGSAKSSRKTRAGAPNETPARAGPFPADLLRRAADIAARYRIILERRDDSFHARGVELPTVFTSAPSADACESKIRELLVLGVATMLELGQTPPLPASDRRVQLNLRLSEDEKLALESAAQRFGFRGVSEYVRFAALAHARSGTP